MRGAEYMGGADLWDAATQWQTIFPTSTLDGLPIAAAIAIAVSVVVGAVASRLLRFPAWRLMLWVAAVALPTAATWTVPAGTEGRRMQWDFCAVGRVPLPHMINNGLPNDVWTNILLTVPAGAAAVLWPWGSRRLAILLATLAGPVVIELVQLLPAMHRGCQLGDMINNILGVILGFLLATGAESLTLAWPVAARGSGNHHECDCGQLGRRYWTTRS